jgi:hypothetical protein
MAHKNLVSLFLLASDLVVRSDLALAQPRDKFNCIGFLMTLAESLLFEVPGPRPGV